MAWAVDDGANLIRRSVLGYRLSGQFLIDLSQHSSLLGIVEWS
jgi:hypothetical protein